MKVLNKYNTGTTIPSEIEEGSIGICVNSQMAELYFKKNNDTIAELPDKNQFLIIDSAQTLTDEQKKNVLHKINLDDEEVTLTITSDNTGKTTGVIISITYGDISTAYTWNNAPLIFTIPMYAEYKISFETIEGFDTPSSQTYKAQRNGSRTITAHYTETGFKDLSMYDIFGELQDHRETANCYVISGEGKYEIPLVYGCAIQEDSVVEESYTYSGLSYTAPFVNYLNNEITSPYIETDTGIEAITGDVIYKDYGYGGWEIYLDDIHLATKTIEIDGENVNLKFLRFEITNIPAQGSNMVIGVKDSSGQVMWSWHIWGYPFELSTIQFDVEMLYKTETHKLLNVNLGWVKDYDGEGGFYENYGTSPYYQWGRKDPVLRASDYTAETFASASTTTYSASTNCANSVAEAIQNPNVYYSSEQTKYNWVTSGGSSFDFLNYWNNYDTYQQYPSFFENIEKTIYDPCPPQFFVPYYNVLNTIAENSTWSDCGINFTYEDAETLESKTHFIPALGYPRIYRSEFSVYLNSTEGNYWIGAHTAYKTPYFSSSLFFDSNESTITANSKYHFQPFSIIPEQR